MSDTSKCHQHSVAYMKISSKWCRIWSPFPGPEVLFPGLKSFSRAQVLKRKSEVWSWSPFHVVREKDFRAREKDFRHVKRTSEPTLGSGKGLQSPGLQGKGLQVRENDFRLRKPVPSPYASRSIISGPKGRYSLGLAATRAAARFMGYRRFRRPPQYPILPHFRLSCSSANDRYGHSESNALIGIEFGEFRKKMKNVDF